MNGEKAIFYLMFISLSLFMVDSGGLVAFCESPNESENAALSTSEVTSPATSPASSSAASPVASPAASKDLNELEEVDLTVYSSSGEKVSKETLEEELYSLFQQAGGEMIVQVATGTSADSFDEEDPLEGTSSGTKSHKKMRCTYSYESPEGEASGRNVPSTFNEMPKMFAELYDHFLKENVLVLTLIYFEIALFVSTSLYYSLIWRDRNQFNGKMIFLNALIEFWENKGFKKNLPLKDTMSRHYLCTIANYKTKILSDYTGYQNEEKVMMENFNKHIDKLSCTNIKESLAILILLFEFKKKLLTSALLFYLLVCSMKEFQGLSFQESFENVKKNERKVVSRIFLLGGRNVRLFLQQLKASLPITSKFKIKESRYPIQFPLMMETINIQNFGLRFCLSLLELFLINSSSFSMMNLIYFFAIRLKSASEVFLAYDIINIMKNIRGGLFEIITAIIFDVTATNYVAKRIMFLHGIDISQLRHRFSECLQIKNNYYELRKLIQLTDYQASSLLKQAEKRRKKGKKP